MLHLIYVGKYSLFLNMLYDSFVLFNFFLNFAPVFKGNSNKKTVKTVQRHDNTGV